MDLTPIDKEYVDKMTAFEINCSEGKGEPMACHQVGEYLSIVKNDQASASSIYRRNCDTKNYGPSCFNLGRLIIGRKIEEKEDKAAQLLFEKACNSGHLAACYHYAIMLYPTAMENFHKRVQDGADTSNLKTDLKESLRLFDQGCKEGEVNSCYFTAAHFLKKENPERSAKVAEPYLKKGCDLNHGPSCHNLAAMYRHGDGEVQANPEQFEIYKKRTLYLLGMTTDGKD